MVLREIVPYEFLSSTTQSNRKILFQNKFLIPLCLSYENCKRPRRNHTPKREHCFVIFISVWNFHISLQFSYQFAILTFWCIVPTWTFAIFIWVCNFHISLQFSHQFAILTSRLQHFLRTWLHMDSMSLWTWTHNSTSATVLRGREQEKLELSKINYYLLLKSS